MKNQQLGFTLLEGIIGLSVLISLLILGWDLSQERLDDTLHQNAAQHLRMVAEAAKQYVQQESSKLASLPQGKELYEKLLTEQFIPSLYATKNIYGQTYEIYVDQKGSPPQSVQIVVITVGGKEINPIFLRRISRRLGIAGGYIDTDSPPSLVGAQQAWKLSNASLPSNIRKDDLKPGHLVSLQYIHAEDITNTSNMLQRTADPTGGLNRMETDLSMQGHKVEFSEAPCSGSLSAQAMTLSAEPSTKITLACEPEKPSIAVEGSSAGLTITDEKISFTVNQQALQKKIGWLNLVKDFSSTELHSLWNKIAYFSLQESITGSDPSGFADQVCRTPGSAGSTGRLFMVGDQGNITYLYVCGDSTPGTPATAQLIRKLDPNNPSQ